jgi:hypothetical protein
VLAHNKEDDGTHKGCPYMEFAWGKDPVPARQHVKGKGKRIKDYSPLQAQRNPTLLSLATG